MTDTQGAIRTQWERAEIGIKRIGRDDLVMVDGYRCAAAEGLALTPGTGIHAGLWTVTHVATGLRLSSCSTRGEAGSLALRLAALGDWTRSRSRLFADVAFITAAAALCGEPSKPASEARR